MARPTNEAAAAVRVLGHTPNYSFSGYGTGYDLLTSWLPELYGVDLIRDMAIMAETDETVGAMLYAISTTMRQIKWEYMPQVNGKDAPDDPEAVKWAELATTMLGDMDRSFGDHVEDFLSMLWAGFAPIEIVFKRRDGQQSVYSDGYYGIDTLNLLDQTTVWDFQYDNNRPVSLKQIGAGVINQVGTGVVPLSKVLLYRVAPRYNNPRGRPLLKNAWRVWRLKRKIQDSEALGIERELCGLPIFEMPEEVILAQFEVDTDGNPTEDALQARRMVEAAKAATQDMRLNKSGGLVIPSDPWGEEAEGAAAGARKYNFRIQTTGGQRSIDSRTAARDYDHAMARVCMMQFLTLGQRSGGSYALSDDQSSMAVSSIMALADILVAEWNKKLVPMSWRVNAWPNEYRPRMRHSDVNKNGIVQLGQYLAGISKAANLWGGDAKMRRALANAANLAYDNDAQEQAAETHREAAEVAAEPDPAPGAAPAAADDEGD